jgi:transposase
MYDGLNVLVTSELDRREEDLIANYKELYKIEESFRVTKTDLKTRPIYVRLDNHIESHFLTCFISLVILRMMQHKLKNQYSAAVIQEGLRSCQLFELGKGYHKISINETVQEIHKDLRIAKIHDVLKKEELNNYYKKSNV